MVMLKLLSSYDAVSEPIFGKFQKKKTQIDRELYLIEKGVFAFYSFNYCASDTKGGMDVYLLCFVNLVSCCFERF